MTWNNNPGRNVPHKLQQACFKRDHYQCTQCGYRGTPGDGTLHADHKHNRATGGPNTLNNLTTLCTNCHTTKTNTERTHGQTQRKARRQRRTPTHPCHTPRGGG